MAIFGDEKENEWLHASKKMRLYQHACHVKAPYTQACGQPRASCMDAVSHFPHAQNHKRGRADERLVNSSSFFPSYL
jgi:hypothetical protein